MSKNNWANLLIQAREAANLRVATRHKQITKLIAELQNEQETLKSHGSEIKHLETQYRAGSITALEYISALTNIQARVLVPHDDMLEIYESHPVISDDLPIPRVTRRKRSAEIEEEEEDSEEDSDSDDDRPKKKPRRGGRK